MGDFFTYPVRCQALWKCLAPSMLLRLVGGFAVDVADELGQIAVS
jgi:hypothetical protein